MKFHAMVLRFLRNKRISFWHVQIAGWTGFVAVYAFLGFLADKEIQNYFIYFGIYLSDGFIIFSLTSLLRLIYTRIPYRKLPFLAVLCVTIAGSLLAAIVWGIAMQWIIDMMYQSDKLTRLLSDVFIAFRKVQFLFPIPFTWGLLYFGTKFWIDWDAEKKRTEKAAALVQKAQIQMLRYQMNPHFLFNALNSVRALVDEDGDYARRIITSLSEYLRYSLVSRKRPLVPLKEELTAARHYLSIEKIRYEEKLTLEFDIDQAVEDTPIPSFLLQPLIDNALKFGMQTSSMPLALIVSAKRKMEMVEICIKNTGHWVEPRDMRKNESGMGLAAVRLRLQDEYPQKHTINIQNKNEQFVTITIQLYNHEEE